MCSDKLAYLARAFQRLRDESVLGFQQARTRVMAEAASKGALQSGNMLVNVGRECDLAANDATNKMLRLTYEVTGSTEPPICEFIERELRTLRDLFSNALADFFRSTASWAPRNATDAVGNDFLNAMDRRISATIDDYRHGILGGARLTKDPLVNVISSIANSPGAVLQTGFGNVQQALTRGEVNAIRSALLEFLKSKEVAELKQDERQSVEDVIEVLTDELDKPKPDPSKLIRWGKRLLDIAERLGIGVAVNAVGHLLFG